MKPARLVIAIVMSFCWRNLHAEEWLYQAGTNPNTGILGHRDGNRFRSCVGVTLDIAPSSHLLVVAAEQSCPAYAFNSITPLNPKLKNQNPYTQDATTAMQAAVSKANALASDQRKVAAIQSGAKIDD